MNDKVFPQIQNGFLDQEPAIREKTVIAVIHLAPKLNFANLDECVVSKMEYSDSSFLYKIANLMLQLKIFVYILGNKALFTAVEGRTSWNQDQYHSLLRKNCQIFASYNPAKSISCSIWW